MHQSYTCHAHLVFVSSIISPRLKYQSPSLIPFVPTNYIANSYVQTSIHIQGPLGGTFLPHGLIALSGIIIPPSMTPRSPGSFRC
jgi:hypothetical protein